MNKTLSVFILFWFCLSVSAGNKIIIAGSDKPYSGQTWFYSGSGNGLQQQKISDNWDEGRRITSAAYTPFGWFIAMSSNSGYTRQTYHYASEWPSDWISENYQKGCYVTNITHGDDKWLIVMSEGTGYTDQTFVYDTWSACKSFISTHWDKGYRITQAMPFKDKWLVFMSANSGIGMQTYSFSNPDGISTRIKEIWDEDYLIQLLEYVNGQYFLVGYKPSNGKSARQTYNIEATSPSSFIDEQWEKDNSITYIGSLHEHNTGNSSTNNSYQNNDQLNYDNYKPYEVFKVQEGDKIIHKQKLPCIGCYGNKTCQLCHGSGMIVGLYSSIPCSACLGSTKCSLCQGRGYTIIQLGVYDKNGNMIGGGNGGYVAPSPNYNNGGGYNGSGYNGGGHNSDRVRCNSCSGTGKCTACGGSGLMKGSYYYTGGDEYITDCPVCHGSGKCGVCYGRGSL